MKNRPLPSTPDVKQMNYWRNGFAATAHAACIWMFAALRKKGIVDPCVAVLCRSNAFVADLSAILAEPHLLNTQRLQPVDHDVVWDAELSVAAATVVASILEWPSTPGTISVARTLLAITAFYQLKHAVEPTKAAAENARKYEESAQAVAHGNTPRIEAAKKLACSVHCRGYSGR